jgi:hypothetical protein
MRVQMFNKPRRSDNMLNVNTPRTTEQIKADQQTIKTKMPKTYKYIQDTVARCGADVFKNVNRGLAGEPNRFIAHEAGVTVGAVFTDGSAMQEIITQSMRYGSVYFCVLVEPA